MNSRFNVSKIQLKILPKIKFIVTEKWTTLLNSSFFRNVFSLSLGTSISQLLIIGSSFITSRLYTPNDFGLQGLVISFTGVFAVAASFGLEVSIVSAEDNKTANAILVLCLLSNIIVALISGVVMAIFILNNFLSFGLLPLWSVFPAAIVIWATGLFMALRYWAVRNNDYKEISRSLIFQGSGRAFTPILFGVFSNSWIGLLLGEIVGRIFGIQKLARKAFQELRQFFCTCSIQFYKKVVFNNWKYIFYGLPSSLINTLYSSLTIPFITTVYNSSLSGQFLFVQNVLAIPTSLISSSVADVFHSRISAVKNETPDKAYDLLRKTMGQLTIIAIIIYVPIAILSPILFPILFGTNWNIAGIIMSYISMLSMFAFVISPLSRIIFVYRKQEYKIAIDIFRLTIPFLSILGAQWFKFDFIFSMVSYTVLGILGYVLYLFIIWKSIQ